MFLLFFFFFFAVDDVKTFIFKPSSKIWTTMEMTYESDGEIRKAPSANGLKKVIDSELAGYFSHVR